MNSRTRSLGLLGAVVGALILAAGCTSQPPRNDVLTGLGLDGMSGQEIVEVLDRSPGPRPFAFSASVGQDEVLIDDGTAEVSVDLPDDQQYVSIAPFVRSTHDCYYHSLASCQGELVTEPVQVTITDDDGRVLVEEKATTYANGFVGYWLPRDINGTIEVSYDGLTGSVPFATTDGSATCITTLRVG